MPVSGLFSYSSFSMPGLLKWNERRNTRQNWGGFWENFILLMEDILHQLIWRNYHYLWGFIHFRWCRISSINSTNAFRSKFHVLLMFFCLFKLIFHGFYHSKSPWNHHLGTIVYCFPTTKQAKSKFCERRWLYGQVDSMQVQALVMLKESGPQPSQSL